MHRTFIPSITPPASQSAPAWWFAFAGNKLLVHQQGAANQLPQLISLEEIGLTPIRTQFLGTLGDRPCYCAELSKDMSTPTGMALQGLRELYGTLDEDLFVLSGRAIQIVEWNRKKRFSTARLCMSWIRPRCKNRKRLKRRTRHTVKRIARS